MHRNILLYRVFNRACKRISARRQTSVVAELIHLDGYICCHWLSRSQASRFLPNDETLFIESLRVLAEDRAYAEDYVSFFRT